MQIGYLRYKLHCSFIAKMLLLLIGVYIAKALQCLPSGTVKSKLLHRGIVMNEV